MDDGLPFKTFQNGRTYPTKAETDGRITGRRWLDSVDSVGECDPMRCDATRCDAMRTRSATRTFGRDACSSTFGRWLWMGGRRGAARPTDGGARLAAAARTDARAAFYEWTDRRRGHHEWTARRAGPNARGERARFVRGATLPTCNLPARLREIFFDIVFNTKPN